LCAQWAASSRPVRARGLKLADGKYLLRGGESRPVRARGLKRQPGDKVCRSGLSRPVRARGLKQIAAPRAIFFPVSRPVRARGLKRTMQESAKAAGGVAPRAGAWIETARQRAFCWQVCRRAPCGRVD